MNYPPATLFDKFLQERLYLKNVTPRTLVWYRVAFNSYRASLAVDAPVLPTRATLQQFLIQLRDRGIRPVTCNTYLAAMNAFCAWLHEEQHIPERVKVKKLRVERRVLELLNEPQMRALIGFKPKTFREARLHLAVLLVLDTGLRVSEALGLRQTDIDADNLILRVFGKGQKERLVPFSPELRKRFYRFEQLRTKKNIRSEFLFAGFGEAPMSMQRCRFSTAATAMVARLVVVAAIAAGACGRQENQPTASSPPTLHRRKSLFQAP